MTSKLVVNTIEADTGISSVSFASSISMNSTAKFHFSAAGIDIGADTNINRPASGVLGFNINSSEKVRIDSSGRLLLGTTTEGYSGGDDLTISTSGDTGITIRSGTSNQGTIAFSDGTSGADEYRGYVQYLHNGNALLFGTDATERLRIASNGLHTINATSYEALTINTTDNGTNGPQVELTHISSSPADGDYIGQLRFTGRDSGGNSTLYGRISSIIDDPTNGQETGHLQFSTRGYSSFNPILRLKNRGTASAPSYTADDINGIILDVYNTGNPYPRYMNFIAKAAGNTDSNIGFWTEAVGGSPTEKLRISSDGTTTFDPNAGGTLKIGGSSAHTSKIVIADNGGTGNGNLLVEGGDGTDFFTIQSNGNVAFENGKGINFGATSDASGMTSELLDDYEEGSWTPAVQFDVGGSGVSYGTRSGTYVKIGRMVHLQYYMVISSGLSSSDYFCRLSLPFTGIGVGYQDARIRQWNTAHSDWFVSLGGAGPVFFHSNALGSGANYARGDDVNGHVLSGQYTLYVS